MHPHRRSTHLLYRRAAHVPGDDRGFTLLEVLVSVAIIGVIIFPLASAMITGYRVAASTERGLTAAANRDRLGGYLSNDTARVDAAGVSLDPSVACNAPPGGTLYVTMNSTRGVGGAPVITRVSYWITGTGRDLTIERHECTSGVVVGSLATGGTVVDVVQDLGKDDSSTIANTIYAPYIDGQRHPCTEFVCGFEIYGRYKIQVTAQRRTFGAGVPVEVGQVYSSSLTRLNADGTGQPAGARAFKRYDTNGDPIDSEEAGLYRFSLPGGLDGPSQMDVDFAVQQVATGLWLESPSAGVYQWGSTANNFVDASYASGVWSLPFEIGPGKIGGHGGEYRVYTKLDSAAAGVPPKDYGGADGFPVWIDYVPTESIFVSTTTGNDANGGLLESEPVKTMARAMQLAASTTSPVRPNVVVADGTYLEALNLSGAGYANNKVITGAHDPSTWLRGGPTVASLTTTIEGTGANYGLQVDGKLKQRFRLMAVDSGDAPAAAGSSVYGAILRNGADVEFDQSTVTARDGRPGANGATGANGAVGCNGGNGVVRGTSSVASWSGPNCANGADTNRKGGYGGAGGAANFGSGQLGGAGGGNGGAYGGNGGGSGGCGGASPGQPGAGGGNAGGGAGGTTPALVKPVNTLWTPTVGTNGQNGTEGRGGGGGGGGGAGFCLAGGNGDSAGAGGEGGLLGAAGGAGGAGGGSFGAYVIGSSTLRLEYSPVVAGRGGNGGNGGRGGNGGNGGRGGNGASHSGLGESSGGGGGGTGGGGGGGGAAGQGGPSVSVAFANGSTVANSGGRPPAPAGRGTNGTVGAAGSGGSAGSGGNGAGSSGAGGNGQSGSGGGAGTAAKSSPSCDLWEFSSSLGWSGETPVCVP